MGVISGERQPNIPNSEELLVSEGKKSKNPINRHSVSSFDIDKLREQVASGIPWGRISEEEIANVLYGLGEEGEKRVPSPEQELNDKVADIYSKIQWYNGLNLFSDDIKRAYKIISEFINRKNKDDYDFESSKGFLQESLEVLENFLKAKQEFSTFNNKVNDIYNRTKDYISFDLLVSKNIEDSYDEIGKFIYNKSKDSNEIKKYQNHLNILEKYLIECRALKELNKNLFNYYSQEAISISQASNNNVNWDHFKESGTPNSDTINKYIEILKESNGDLTNPEIQQAFENIRFFVLQYETSIKKGKKEKDNSNNNEVINNKKPEEIIKEQLEKLSVEEVNKLTIEELKKLPVKDVREGKTDQYTIIYGIEKDINDGILEKNSIPRFEMFKSIINEELVLELIESINKNNFKEALQKVFDEIILRVQNVLNNKENFSKNFLNGLKDSINLFLEKFKEYPSQNEKNYRRNATDYLAGNKIPVNEKNLKIKENKLKEEDLILRQQKLIDIVFGAQHILEYIDDNVNNQDKDKDKDIELSNIGNDIVLYIENILGVGELENKKEKNNKILFDRIRAKQIMVKEKGTIFKDKIFNDILQKVEYSMQILNGEGVAGNPVSYYGNEYNVAVKNARSFIKDINYILLNNKDDKEKLAKAFLEILKYYKKEDENIIDTSNVIESISNGTFIENADEVREQLFDKLFYTQVNIAKGEVKNTLNKLNGNNLINSDTKERFKDKLDAYSKILENPDLNKTKLDEVFNNLKNIKERIDNYKEDLQLAEDSKLCVKYLEIIKAELYKKFEEEKDEKFKEAIKKFKKDIGLKEDEEITDEEYLQVIKDIKKRIDKEIKYGDYLPIELYKESSGRGIRKKIKIEIEPIRDLEKLNMFLKEFENNNLDEVSLLNYKHTKILAKNVIGKLGLLLMEVKTDEQNTIKEVIKNIFNPEK